MGRAWGVPAPVIAFDGVTAIDYAPDAGDVACRPIDTDPKAGCGAALLPLLSVARLALPLMLHGRTGDAEVAAAVDTLPLPQWFTFVFRCPTQRMPLGLMDPLPMSRCLP